MALAQRVGKNGGKGDVGKHKRRAPRMGNAALEQSSGRLLNGQRPGWSACDRGLLRPQRIVAYPREPCTTERN